MKRLLPFSLLTLLAAPMLSTQAHAQWNTNDSLFGASQSSSSAQDGGNTTGASSGGGQAQKEKEDEKPDMAGGYIDQFGLPRAQMKVINGRAMLMAPPQQEKRNYGIVIPPPPRAPDDGRATGTVRQNTGSVTGSNRQNQNDMAKKMKAKLPYPDHGKDDTDDSDD